MLVITRVYIYSKVPISARCLIQRITALYGTCNIYLVNYRGFKLRGSFTSDNL